MLILLVCRSQPLSAERWKKMEQILDFNASAQQEQQ